MSRDRYIFMIVYYVSYFERTLWFMFDLNLTKINNFGLSVLPHSKFNYFITFFLGSVVHV